MSGTGDNRVGDNSVGGIGAYQLKSYIECIERLEEEKAATALDIREVYAEAKSNGYDAKIMRIIVRLRKMDEQERQEEQAVLDLYMHALGFDNTPLGAAAQEGQD